MSNNIECSDCGEVYRHWINNSELTECPKCSPFADSTFAMPIPIPRISTPVSAALFNSPTSSDCTIYSQSPRSGTYEEYIADRFAYIDELLGCDEVIVPNTPLRGLVIEPVHCATDELPIPSTAPSTQVITMCWWCQKRKATPGNFCSPYCHDAWCTCTYPQIPAIDDQIVNDGLETGLPVKRRLTFDDAEFDGPELTAFMSQSIGHICDNARCPIALAKRVYTKSCKEMMSKRQRTCYGITPDAVCQFYQNKEDEE